MHPILWAQAAVAHMPPHEVTALLLLLAVAMTLITGLLRAPRDLPRALPGLAYIAVAAFSFAPGTAELDLPGFPWSPIAVAAVLLLLHFLCLGASPPLSEPQPRSPSTRRWLLAAVLLGGAFLLYDLGGYVGSVLVWESPVVDGFGKAFLEGKSVPDYALERFYWDNGVLSAGHTSLFFGAPTYALFHAAGFGTWTLRLCAVLATLLGIVVIFQIGRSFFGNVTAAAAAVLLALNVAVIYYGRYGSSAAGTILAVELAFLTTGLFLLRERRAWWMAPICAAALFAATLQYSPARLVVLILLGMIGLASVVEWRRLWWRRAVGLVIILAAVAGVWTFQKNAQRSHLFLFARGEQFFHFIEHPHYVRELFGKDLTERKMDPDRLSWGDKLYLLTRVVSVTAPQYAKMVLPDFSPQRNGFLLSYDPPNLPLYYAPVIVFLVWGIGVSVVRRREWPHFALLAWLVLMSGPLLLTNRVDSHRTVLFVIPFSIWAGLGLREAARIAARTRLPAAAAHVFAGLLVATAVYEALTLVYHDRIPEPKGGEIFREEIQTVPGSVYLGARYSHTEVAWTQLHMLERTRQDPERRGDLLPERLKLGLTDEAPVLTPIHVHELRRLVQDSTVLLYPSKDYTKIAARMQQYGLRVTERGTPRFRMLRMDAGAEATGLPDDEMKPIPTIYIPPTPTPIPLRGGPQLPIGELRDIEFSFEPPKIDRTWDNTPIRMGGTEYARGIGTHASTRFTLDVPERAVAFQAIVGLSDKVRECGRAAVIFRVLDGAGQVLYETDVLDSESPPRPLRVDVSNEREIALVVSDAGNGIDCDHANWANPTFLLPMQPTRTAPAPTTIETSPPRRG